MKKILDLQPPKIFLRFFRWYCDPVIVEDIEGDLREMFERDKINRGPVIARTLFSLRVLHLCRPGIIRKISQPLITRPSPMFKNYFVTSMRSLMRSKTFSAINIVGLAIGLATFSLIAFYVYHELSFDRYHEKADRIFRVVENLRTENEILFQSTSSPPMGPYFLKDFPEVESYVRFQKWNMLVQRNDMSAYETDCYLTDSTLFDVFSFNLVKGDRKSALRDPYSIVVTESIAKKYFGDEDPVGQSIRMDNDNFQVTGVMEDVPENSHFPFTILISFSTWSQNNKQAEDRAWFWNGFHTYLLLKDASSADKVRAKIPGFLERNVEKGGMYYEDLPLQPLTSIYMAEARSWENGTRGSMNNVYVLSIIAVFILLIACFNYINMATARASRRLKEVGLRKTLGALRRMLVAQFLGESLIVTFSAALLAALIAWLVLPSFRVLVESQLSLSVLPEWWRVIVGSVGLIVLVSLLAGVYPAFIISRFQPLQIFRPAVRGIFGHQSLRKVLVGIQFMISIMLVAGTMLVYDQLDAIRNQNMGFRKDGIIFLRTNTDSTIVNHLEAFKNELKNVPGVVNVTGSSSIPGHATTNNYTEIEMADGKMSPTNINFNYVDHDFLTTYDLEIVEGRDFRKDVKADDTTAYLINETAVRNFGWTLEETIGKKVNGRYKGQIIGVVKDFHYRSLHTRVEPLMFALTPYVGRMSIRLDNDDLPATIDRVQRKWSELAPHLPFDYSFLDVDLALHYKADQQLGRVAGVFTGLAMFIGCLGLLGLTSFVVERRTREIGIRKVLGASATSVIILISQEFIWLIAVALIIATPVTWYLVEQWEQNFVLQSSINPLRFLVAGFLVLLIGWLSISFLSLRAARTNPVAALKTE